MRCPYCGGNLQVRGYFHKTGNGFICYQCTRSDDVEWEEKTKKEKNKKHGNYRTYGTNIEYILKREVRYE